VTTDRSTITIGARPASIADVCHVADGAPVDLSAEAMKRIRGARSVVDGLIEGDELIYGLNTGLGHMRDMRVGVDVLRAYQEAIVVAHDGGMGPPLPTAVVRAAMFVRVLGLANGGAGATPGVAEVLVGMLNRGVHPVVPRIGSVGASDLMHLAAIALVATGLGGRAEIGGDVLSGPDALRRAGLTPARLEPKDGLAVISANAVSVGHGALVAARAVDVVGVADLIVAASMEAIGGNPSVVDPLVGAAKGIAGQVESADAIRRHLAGSDRCVPGAPASVQDPLSFRVAPQVHGACREVVRFLADAVVTELAACDDNPLVSRAERRLISNGNFHPMVLALAADAVRPALAHVGQLSDRRMGHLWAAAWQDPALLEVDGMRAIAESGGGLLRYAAAARFTELRALAGPVSLDVPPLDIGVEDHATNAPLTVARTEDALDALEDVLAVELLMAHESLHRRAESTRLGDGVRAALDALAGVRASLGPRPPSDVLHAAVRAALRQTVLPAAEAANGA
jgi:histidine ammonia-lyase